MDDPTPKGGCFILMPFLPELNFFPNMHSLN